MEAGFIHKGIEVDEPFYILAAMPMEVCVRFPRHVLLLASLVIGACTTSLPVEQMTPDTSTRTLTASPTPTPTPTPLVEYPAPAWFESAVVYEIFVRSFADSDEDGIGDLVGIQQQLDYLLALSVDAIWLMPIYPSPSVHGYDVIDPFEINPDYGTHADLLSLVEAAHARGIRVILDFVPSHVSNQHPYFLDAYRNPESAYTDWFVWTNDAHTTYATFAGVAEMPRLNHYNPEVVNYLIEAALFWMDLDGDGELDDGIDGFRIDNATFPPQELTVELRQALKAVNPEVLLLGEAWLHNHTDLARYYPDQFDALFDFPLYELLQGDHASNGDGLLAGRGFPALLRSQLEESFDILPEGALAVRFLSNHDTNRIRSEVRSDEARLRFAARVLVTLPGPILLYYGEEIGMPGQKGGAPYYDHYRREPMDWYAGEEGTIQTTWFVPEDRWNQPLDGVSVEEQVDVTTSILNEYRRLLALRAENPALQRGDMQFLDLEATTRGPIGYRLLSDTGSLIVVHHFGEEPALVRIALDPSEMGEYVDLFRGNPAGNVDAEGFLVIELEPADSVLLARTENTID